MRTPIFILICLLVAIPCQARIITVDDGPADFNNIQAAIDDSNDGDFIYIFPGTYTGSGNRDIDFQGKAIAVQSIAPTDPYIVAATVIDCNGTWEDSHRGFIFDTNETYDSVLAGITITNGDFRYIGDEGGAIYCNGASPTISNCRIINNKAGYGGGIACIDSNAVLSNCIVKGNYTEGCGSNGGGIYCRSSDVLIKQCIITENNARDRQGGGIFCNDSNCVITQCLIFGNKSAEEGGGIVCVNNSHPEITSCTIADNRSSRAGGIRVDCGHAVVSNSILWGNRASEGDQIGLGGDYSYEGEITLNYCDIEGLRQGVVIDGQGQLNLETGNINENPLFIQQGQWDDGGTPEWSHDDFFLGDGDYHLLSGSPCINAGDPNFTPEPDETDLDGSPRIIGTRIDIGAYEFYYQSPYIQLDKYGFVFGTPQASYNPPEQLLQISNLGISSFLWEIYEDCPWLEAIPAGGEVSATEVNEVTLWVDANGLEPGKHTCQLTISSDQAINSPQTVEVLLYIYIDSNALTVPYEYTTIQDAIDAASDGNTIIVALGTYNENIDFKGKNITLSSIDPNIPLVAQGTIICGDGNSSVVTFAGTEDANCALLGFTVTGGDNAERGGGIWGNGCLAAIENCVIKGNSASKGNLGGGGGLSWCNGPISNCTIADNSANEFGGGLEYCGGPISNCIIADNSANDYGGGLSRCYGPISNCTITNNSAGDRGGGMEGCAGPITNCIIANNWAGYSGGGLEYCNGLISNCTIANNRAGNSGAGLEYCYGLITNCIIWHNQPADSALRSSTLPLYTCTQGDSNGLGCISSDPCFVNPQNGNYHLTPESPCIDAGNYAYCMTLPCTDCDGGTRLVGGQIDMGCYEANSLPDADGDWLADDYEPGYTESADRDDDGIADGLEIFRGTDPNVFDPLSQWNVPADVNTIQEAIFFSRAGETIVVSQGVYYESLYIGGRNIILTSANPYDPCVVAVTVVNGDTDANSQTPNSSTITLTGTEDANCQIRGLTITGAYGLQGGGIYGGGSLAAIAYCTVTGNKTNSYGGGIYDCDGEISNCTISNNLASIGGGISRCDGSINNCLISNNTAKIYGGGLYSCNGSINNCTVTANICLYSNANEFGGGGFYKCNGSINNCTITDNYVPISGGGLKECNGSITNCTIAGNLADKWGGGMYGCYGPISNCIITGNTAGIYGGGLYACNGSITNCTISGNSAQQSGGGLRACRDTLLTNCTITGNYAGNYGGGIDNRDWYGGWLTVTLTNCILWANSCYAGMDESTQIYSGRPVLNYCCVQGWTGNLGGAGNIDADPCFVDPNGDYHLKSKGWRWDSQRKIWTWDDVTSRCADAGNPGSPLGVEPLSVPRDPNNDWGKNIRINMGAFGGTAEASMPPYNWTILADLTNDGKVDSDDLAVFVNYWLEAGQGIPSDLNRSDSVDLIDFALLGRDWFEETSWHEPEI